MNYQKVIDYCKGKVTFLSKSKYGTITVTPKDINELLSLANQIYQSGLVEWSEPNFIVEIIKHQSPTDPLFNQQYYLKQNNNIDINAPKAWQLNTGLNVVRVAVIDDGVEEHEDLNGRVLQGFTPLDPNGFGAPTNNLPPANEGIIGHGQACAGIIGATHNNVGIAGVSPSSEIVPINIFNSWILDFNFPAGQRLRWIEDAQNIADAINWAWDDGQSDILSNSWGYNTTNPNNIIESGQIIQAINNARTQGRGGLGSLVVFSSGNSNPRPDCPVGAGCFNGVTFPANVDGVITVGAIDRNGNIWNYSSRGAEMDLVAPSGNGASNSDVVTTDRMGNLGYDPGNYTFTFGGTSAAAPQVSGVAALMLSVNCNLTENEVRSILQQTATDMGSAGFNNTFGFGRVNAFDAVQAALPTISGPDFLCTSSSYSLQNPPAGSMVSWSVSPTNLFSGATSGTGATASLSPASSAISGTATLTFNVNTGCGEIEITKDITVGSPKINMGTYSYNNNTQPTQPYFSIINNVVCDLYTPVSAEIPIEAGISNFHNLQILHVSDPSLTYNVTFSDDLATIYFDFWDYGQEIIFRLTTQNDCGSDFKDFAFRSEQCYGYLSDYKIYPNPASDVLNIEINQSESPESKYSKNGKIELKLFDASGNEVHAAVTSEKKTIVDVRKFKYGFYYLHIIHQEGVIRRQIRIEK
ncbi:S8 family serine peptidase [Belliella kenyensis]|uniref:S8 family serine peptidase n=1 Tax=Belliella kenyensis TaxID=1472724 RepID=A0ABV8EIY8_9BACT|nr:S8 family serine peptidase [Belliella kenyensis]MCH7403082.1 S8 family peptidase [Belliella kenyensis]MDN3602251.1 S8 family serine peptidase [Belliella kenyensis]